MKKIFFSTVLLLTLLSLPTFAQLGNEVICTDNPPLGSTCKFVTPPITVCSNFTYSIVDQGNTTLINNSPLTVRDASLDLYEFDFNLTSQRQQLSIILCDGTFREVIIGGDDVIPSIVTGQLFFLTFTGIITLLLLFFAVKIEDPVMGFLGTTGLFIIGWVLLDNPFRFLNGEANFIGMNLFGLGIIVFGIYFLINSLRLLFKGKSEVGFIDE